MAQILDGGVGGNPVEGRHGILSHKRLIVELLDEHIHGTLCTALFFKEVHTNAVGHIAIHAGSAQGFALHELHSQLGHNGGSFTHTGSTVGGGDDEDLVLQVGTGILFVHTGEHGDAHFLNGYADICTGITVTAGVKGGASDEQVRLEFLDPAQNLLFGFLFMFGKIAVAAHDGVNDLSFTLPLCFQSSTGAYGAFPELGSYMGHFLAADLGEELVDVMNNTITHAWILLSHYLAER